MYDIVPDLLKAYYFSMCVVAIVSGFLGFSLCMAWRDRHEPLPSGAACDAMDPETDHDAVAMRLIESCDFL